MLNLMKRIAKDENGFVVSSELVLVLTIAVIGMIVGLDSVQNAVTQELADVAAAFGQLNQSYTYSGFVSGAGLTLIQTNGSGFTDVADNGDATGIAKASSQSVSITAFTPEP